MKKRIKWEYNKLITNLLIVLTIFLGFKCLYEANYYRLLICLIAIPVIILPKIFKKKINFPDELEWFYLIFIFFSLTLGSIINLYDIVLWYDNLIHFISGILTSILASYLISGFEVKTKKIIFNIIFIVSFSIALAGLWEIFEFTADNLTGQDAQDFLLTGLDDTMYDLILATFGSILYGIYYYKKHR